MYFIYCLLVLIVVLTVVAPEAHSGIFSKMKEVEKEVTSHEDRVEDIKVLDSVDKLIIKRKKEAEKLVLEGNKLIKKGEKRNRKDLITKGQIKKDIGEKQLKILNNMNEDKRKEDESYDW